MKKLIEKHQIKIEECKLSIENMFRMIDAGKNGDESVDIDDLLEEISNAKYACRMNEKFIKDLEGCETLIIMDYLVDLNKEFGTDSSGRRILRVEQGIFDKMKSITESIK